MWLVYALITVFCWSLAIVFDSTIVKLYLKNPLVLMWTQACFSVVILSAVFPFISSQTPWMLPLVLSGLIAYCGDLVFFLAVDRMDASVFNIAWALLAILMSIVGFLFFSESWTLLQTVGVCCILFGVLLLSYRHQHITLPALGLLIALAVLYAPGNVAMKAAVDAGEDALTAMFWMLVAREFFAFLFPWCLPRFRRSLVQSRVVMDGVFIGLSGFVVAVYILGEFFTVKAFAVGSLSLVSVITNLQPFVVLILAWLLLRLAPRYASRELLDRQSVQLKLASFCVVFVGMVLLAV